MEVSRCGCEPVGSLVLAEVVEGWQLGHTGYLLQGAPETGPSPLSLGLPGWQKYFDFLIRVVNSPASLKLAVLCVCVRS